MTKSCLLRTAGPSLTSISISVNATMIEKESELNGESNATLIERRNGRRRYDLPHEFPLTDSQIVFVTRDRRRLPDRRTVSHDLDDLVEKVSYLKTAVYATPLQHALNKHDSVAISRVLHEISIGELAFLLACSGNLESLSNSDTFSSDEEQTIGLMNLGLLSRRTTKGTGKDAVAYNFTSLADRLVKLLEINWVRS